jgi:hypothetical protein
MVNKNKMKINKDIKQKVIETKENILSKLGIKIFEDDTIKLNWFNIDIGIISNAYLITLKYLPLNSNCWYQCLYTLKSKEEIDTFVMDVSKHLL